MNLPRLLPSNPHTTPLAEPHTQGESQPPRAELKSLPTTKCCAAAELFLRTVSFMLLISSCVTPETLSWGVQPEYQALNPSRILAITPIVMAMPADQESNIDTTVMQTVPVIASLEKHVLEAFTDQPGVNGMSFTAVRNQLEKEKSKAFDQLLTALNDTVSLLRIPRKEQISRLTGSCMKRRNFLEFYQFCLREQLQWRSSLNQLARDALNADAALFLFMTQLEKKAPQSEASATIHALLIDTNNGRLIWAGQNQETIRDDLTQKPALTWDALMGQTAGDELWSGFPGRLTRASGNAVRSSEAQGASASEREKSVSDPEEKTR